MKKKPAAIYNCEKLFGRAVKKYTLLEENDNLLVVFSGSRNSLPLLNLILERLKYIPVSYSVNVAVVYPDFYPLNSEYLDFVEKFLVERKIPFVKEVFKLAETKGNVCVLCSRERRKRVLEIARNFKVNKIVFPSTLDDFVYAITNGMFFQGKIETLLPKRSTNEFVYVRPMVFCENSLVSKYNSALGFPEFNENCPHSNEPHREVVFGLLSGLPLRKTKIKYNILNSVFRINSLYLP